MVKMQVSPERAHQLVQDSAAVLLLDIPAGTRVGLDQMVSAHQPPQPKCIRQSHPHLRGVSLNSESASNLGIRGRMHSPFAAVSNHCGSAPCHAQFQCYVSHALYAIRGYYCRQTVVLMASCGGVQSYVVTGSFRGWKMVPGGPHYLTYNAASRSGDFAPAVAVLCHLAGRQVLVRRWAPALELLLPLDDEEEVPFPTHDNGLTTEHYPAER